MQPTQPTQSMPNPFLTNPSNHHKKGRPPLPVQENPFLSTTKCNRFLEHKFTPEPEPVQSPPSFEELFPSLTQSSSAKGSSAKSSSEKSPVPKLNFKCAVQGHQGQPSHQGHQGHQGQPSQQGHQGQPSQPSQPSQPQNQFLHPVNQFLQPRAYNRMRYGYDDSEPNDDDGDTHDAYDSAYTKYYDD